MPGAPAAATDARCGAGTPARLLTLEASWRGGRGRVVPSACGKVGNGRHKFGYRGKR